MKKALSLLLTLIMIVSLAACGDQPQPDITPKSEEMYTNFLKGEELLYPGSYEWNFAEYNYETEDFDYTPVLDEANGAKLDQVIASVVYTTESITSIKQLEQVSYAFIDCGKDGEPELAIRLTFTNDWEEYSFAELVVKNIEGKLRLCMINYTEYRSYQELTGDAGLIMYGGSSSGFVTDSAQGYLNADGEFKTIYMCTEIFDFQYYTYFYKDASDVEKLTQEEMDTLDNELTVFNIYSIYEAPGQFKEVFSIDPYTQEYAEILKKLDLDVVSEEDVFNLISEARNKQGLSDKLIEENTLIEWTPISNTMIDQLVKYGVNPVFVSSVDELFAALADNTTIVMDSSVHYDLTDWIERPEHEQIITEFDYNEFQSNEPGIYTSWGEMGTIMINGYNYLTIMSSDDNLVKITIRNEENRVLDFTNCYGLTLEKLSLGHQVPTNGCSGEVLGLYYADNTTINGCDLYGCGTYGIDATACEYITVRDTVIHDCSYGLMSFDDCDEIDFRGCTFKNGGYSTAIIFCGQECSMYFSDCSFSNLGYEFIYMDFDSEGISFNNCLFDADALEKLDAYTGFGYVYYN